MIMRDPSAPRSTIKMLPHSFWGSLHSAHRLHKSAQLAAHWSGPQVPVATAPRVLAIWYHFLPGVIPQIGHSHHLWAKR